MGHQLEGRETHTHLPLWPEDRQSEGTEASARELTNIVRRAKDRVDPPDHLWADGRRERDPSLA